MRFDGEWVQCDDGIVRPVLEAEILAGDGSWRRLELLVDTGADRTVLSADVWLALDIEPTDKAVQLGGVGGLVPSVRFRSQFGFRRHDGKVAMFRGEYAACLEPDVLDMSVLGRDITDMFALIADKKNDRLTLIGGNHSYSIQQS